MEMLNLIDWRMVLFSGLWISGVAVILTAFGFADYHASISSRRLREVVGRPGTRVAINAGLMLFCLGLLGSSHSAWKSAAWGLLAAGFLAYAARAWCAAREGQEG
ncbi:MAG: hypothetical protein ACE5JF_13575 [Anaerolineales bacterium]